MKRKRIFSLALALVLALTLIPATAAAEEGPAVSRNKNAQDYSRWSKPVTSYLYENPQGGLTRVEYLDGQVLVENYDSDFNYLDSRSIPAELPLWGGFFAGGEYNFLIFGQKNAAQDDSAEVIRVVKYGKDWTRLGQASLRGANTTKPFDAGSLRCDEYAGYLYIRTCHEMYQSDDGLNHQSNLTMAVRQSDMEITDSYYDVRNAAFGYVSHSFNQFILVDEDGKLVALDHGDAYPRGVAFSKYYADAATGKFTSSGWDPWCSYGNLIDFGGGIGDNTTGAGVGGLGETTDCYVMAYSYDGAGSGGDRYPYYHYMDKATGKSWSVRLQDAPGVTTPVLAPLGLDGGYVLWNGKESAVDDTLYCVPYAADGTPGEMIVTTGCLSDCQPIPYQGGAVWYVTDNSAPVFYLLKDGQVTTTAAEPEPVPDDAVEVTDPESAAQALYKMGLFMGTGNNADGSPNFALNRASLRSEAITMLVRLLGKEQEALAGTWTTPFTDVPAWLEPYVGYAYANSLTNGTSATTFGSDRTISASEYLTLVLRALGYESGKDFQWDSAWTLSDPLGLTQGQFPGQKSFFRGDMAEISYYALSTRMKDGADCLYEAMDIPVDAAVAERGQNAG